MRLVDLLDFAEIEPRTLYCAGGAIKRDLYESIKKSSQTSDQGLSTGKGIIVLNLGEEAVESSFMVENGFGGFYFRQRFSALRLKSYGAQLPLPDWWYGC